MQIQKEKYPSFKGIFDLFIVQNISEIIPDENHWTAVHGDRAKLYEEVREKNDRPMSQATFYRLCRSLEKILCGPESQEWPVIKPEDNDR